MASQLEITKTIQNNQWLVEAEVIPGGTLPANIFVYENSGTIELGTFFGVASVTDLGRMQVWSGVAIPTFGNKYILHSQAKIYVVDSSPDSVINVLINSVKLLSTALQSASSTTIHNIP